MEARLETSIVCERTRVYVSLEVDGELSEFERGFLTTHLERCSACRAYRADVHALAREMREAPPEVPTRRVCVPVPSRPLARLARYPLGAAAAVAVAVLGTASLVTPSIDREPTFTNYQETFPFPTRDPDAVVSRGGPLTNGLTAGPNVLTMRSAGVDFIR